MKDSSHISIKFQETPTLENEDPEEEFTKQHLLEAAQPQQTPAKLGNKRLLPGSVSEVNSQATQAPSVLGSLFLWVCVHLTMWGR